MTEHGTIDLTPTWSAIMPLLIIALTDGTEDGRDMAEVELKRLAKLMDELMTEYSATKETLTEKVVELRDRHGKPAGSAFEEGQWDMAQRIIGLLSK